MPAPIRARGADAGEPQTAGYRNVATLYSLDEIPGHEPAQVGSTGTLARLLDAGKVIFGKVEAVEWKG